MTLPWNCLQNIIQKKPKTILMDTATLPSSTSLPHDTKLLLRNWMFLCVCVCVCQRAEQTAG